CPSVASVLRVFPWRFGVAAFMSGPFSFVPEILLDPLGKISYACIMQLLSNASSSRVGPKACARELMETVPSVMQYIRRQMRSLRGQDLTIPQIRTLWFITQHTQ